MSYKSRLLTTAFVLPVLMTSLPAFALDVQTAVTAEEATLNSAVDADGLHSISSAGSVTITGPTVSGAAVVINHSDAVDVSINGTVSVVDENSDGTIKYDTSGEYGVWVKDPFSGDLILGASASILLLDSLARVDNDEDGILDGITLDQDTVDTADDVPSATNFAQDSGRIGLFIEQAMNGNLLSVAGSRIAVTSDNGLGLYLDSALTGNIDLRGTISVVGSQLGASGYTAAVYIDPLATITGRYIQAGTLSATGIGASGLIVEGGITGGLQIEGSITSTGYQTTAVNNRGLLAADSETNLDANELQQGGSAVVLKGDITQGILINGPINSRRSADETTSLTAITTARGNDEAVNALKTQPYHFDENRGTGRITTYGSAPALAISTGTFGQIVEGFADTRNDDNDTSTAFSGATFSYSNSFINRGAITANGWNDGISATAVSVGNGAILDGGFLNAGTISATAYNNNATAISLESSSFGTVSLASDIFINEGTISATVTSNTKTDATATGSSYAAKAVALSVSTALPNAAVFVNRGAVYASSTHIDGTTSVSGDKAIAYDFSTYSGDALSGGITLRQSLRENDQLNISNQYLGNGDLDLDVVGDTDADDNAIGDGFVTSQDVQVPAIIGDVYFSAYNDTLDLTSGTMFSNVYFGQGNDVFNISNPEANPIATSTYEKPYTVFVGALTSSGGKLDVNMSGRSRMIFSNQEVIDEGVNLNSLSIADEADIGFVVDSTVATPNTALVNVQNLTISGTDFKISPALENIVAESYSQRFIQTASDLSSYSATINDHLSGNQPFIYNVSLAIEDIVANGDQAITATFAIKTATELGLNTTQAPSLNAVLSHFGRHSALETALAAIDTQANFATAYDQILPHYGDGTMRQLSMLATSANGSVSQHMQLVKAGGRSGGEGWLQQFGDYRKQDATTEGGTLRGDSYSIAYGYDAPVLGLDALGFFTQLSFSNVDEKTSSVNEVKSEGWAIGAYLAHEIGPIGIELTAQGGNVKFDSERIARVGDASDILRDGWDGTSFAASAKLAVPILTGRHSLQAEFGTDFFSLEQDAHTETSVYDMSLGVHVGSATSELTTNHFGLRGQANYGGGSPVAVTWSPNYYIGYQSVGTYQPFSANVNFVGSNESFVMKTATEIADQTNIGFGVSAHNDYFAVELSYRAAFGDDVNVQGGGLAIRLKF
jgi:hypothetical protein